MFTVISGQAKIEELQKQFHKALISKLKYIGSRKYSHGGGDRLLEEVYVNEGIDSIWYGSQLSPKTNPKRYWNAFGFYDPILGEPLKINVEINFPINGEGRRTGGLFIKKNDKVFVCHRGKIIKKKGSEPFHQWYEKQYPNELERIDEKDPHCIILSALSNERIIDNIVNFMSKVKQYKI